MLSRELSCGSAATNAFNLRPNRPASGRERHRGGFVKLVLLVAVLLAGVGVVATLSAFRGRSDAASLRDGITKVAGADWEQHMELGVGPFILLSARAAAALVPLKLPPEVHAGLKSVRRVRLIVGRFHDAPRELNVGELLAGADAAMTPQGWQRTVNVAHEGQWVAVYIRERTWWRGGMSACVAVLDGRQLIVVNAAGDIQPILDVVLASEKSNGRLPLDAAF